MRYQISPGNNTNSTSFGRWVCNALYINFYYVEFSLNDFILDHDFLAEVTYLLNYTLIYQIYHDVLESLFYLIQIGL